MADQCAGAAWKLRQPFFDEAGNVVDRLLAKLNAVKVAKVTGGLPQNLNHAVKATYSLPLLDLYSALLPTERELTLSNSRFDHVVEQVQEVVVLIVVY